MFTKENIAINLLINLIIENRVNKFIENMDVRDQEFFGELSSKRERYWHLFLGVMWNRHLFFIIKNKKNYVKYITK